MKRSILLIAALAATSLLAEELTGTATWGGRRPCKALVNPTTPRAAGDVLSLRGEWEFVALPHSPRYRSASWGLNFRAETNWPGSRTIRVPGCWEAQGVGATNALAWGKVWDSYWDAGYRHLRHIHSGEGWYRRTVTVPADWAGRRVWIALGGVNAQGWVWVNGREVAWLHDWCGTYRFDVTDLVEPGKPAEIVIEADNKVPSRKGLFNYSHRWGGLYRDVELQATADCWIEDAWVKCAPGDRPAPEPHVELGGDTNGVEVAVSYSANTFDWWTPDDPRLYFCTIELKRGGETLERRVERFGLKRLEVRGEKFCLNGEPIFLRGFGDDAVYPITGMSPPDKEYHRRHLEKAKRAGFNFVRLHTHCELPEYFEAADEVGILVEAELPYYCDLPSCDFDFDPIREARELHGHYRRYVSFAVTSGCNEGTFGSVLSRSFYRTVKALDPDRLVIETDSNGTDRFNLPGASDYASGPIQPWPKGGYAPGRPFVCHEYLNLCVKLSAALEPKFTGVWLPPERAARRDAWLATFGLDRAWGDRLQLAQHRLQAIWARRGVQSAHEDPHCSGYCYWTIVDVCAKTDEGDDVPYTSQGLFDPFWNDKPGGLSAEGFAPYNRGERQAPGDGLEGSAVPRLAADGVEVVTDDLARAEKLFAAGKRVLFVGGLQEHGTNLPLNVTLGWWSAGAQVGTALKEHPVWGDFRHDGAMDERFFRIVKKGAPLPLAGFAKDDLVMVSEGAKACFVNLAVKAKGGAKMVFAWGLDILADYPESVLLYNGFIRFLLQPSSSERRI